MRLPARLPLESILAPIGAHPAADSRRSSQKPTTPTSKTRASKSSLSPRINLRESLLRTLERSSRGSPCPSRTATSRMRSRKSSRSAGSLHLLSSTVPRARPSPSTAARPCPRTGRARISRGSRRPSGTASAPNSSRAPTARPSTLMSSRAAARPLASTFQLIGALRAGSLRRC